MTTKLLLLVALLPALGLADLPPREVFSRKVYETLKIEAPSFAALRCDDVEFSAAQSEFNKFFGIGPEYNWRKASELDQTVMNYMRDNTTTFLKACDQRKAFYQRMAMMWDSCINRYYLINKLGSSATNISAPFIYVAMWQHLDFICNGGKELALANWFDLHTFKYTDDFTKCQQNFHNSVNADPNSYCPSAQTFIHCSNKAYETFLPDKSASVGWFICEDLRVGYAYDCPDLRCYVIKSN
ncbi:hypothetical protein QR680_018148 [Steinernema hermaphroditum]|uniref:SCP domain-containing protein n=1 Tax=Steinernema hermaphroditum TaxID=289476 RepID=A0AA39HH12_9BILA|nr:hypothetical protein QR680_018148 [Steinernema hermaphroditum]